ncbi:MAG: PilN domain-containing protein [Terriglobia bacterium]
MRINVNLTIAPSARERYALAWAIPTGVIAAAGLVLLSILAVRNYREYRRAHQALVELQQIEATMRDQEAAIKKDLERPQLDAMLRQAQFVNGVIDRRRFSLTELVEKVTKLLPGQARLDSFALTQAGTASSVRLSVAAKKDEDMEKFLENLEDSPDFVDVSVLSQGVGDESAEGGPSPVTVVCTARYVGGDAP